jgi:hypothetical protein
MAFSADVCVDAQVSVFETKLNSNDYLPTRSALPTNLHFFLEVQQCQRER